MYRKEGWDRARQLAVLLAIVATFPAVTHATTVSTTCTFDSVNIVQRHGPDTVYDAVSVNGCRPDLDVLGAPELPIRTVFRVIQWGEKVDSAVVAVVAAETLDHPNMIWPVQPPPCSLTQAGGFVYPNLRRYIYGFPASHSGGTTTASMSNYRLAALNLYPVRVLPDGRLEFATSLAVDIYTSASTEQLGCPPERRSPFCDSQVRTAIAALTGSPGADGLARSVSVQPHQSPLLVQQAPSLDGDCADCVIITEAASATDYQEYADFLSQRGIVTVLRTIEWISGAYSGHDIAECIREFIKDAASHWGTDNFLLAGWQSDEQSEAGLPTRLIQHSGAEPYSGGRLRGWTTTDHYYDDLDGTWNEDNDDVCGESYYDLGASAAMSFADGLCGTAVRQYADYGTLVYSTSNGQDWALKGSLPATEATALWMQSEASGYCVGYALSSPGNPVALRTTDGGASWVKPDLPPQSGCQLWAVTGAADGVTAWAVGNTSLDPTVGVVVRTTDEGHEWHTATTPPTGSAMLSDVDVVQDGPERSLWVCATSGGLLRSTDDGANWSNAGLAGDMAEVHAVRFVTAEIGVAGGCALRTGVNMAAVWYTTNGGDDWVGPHWVGQFGDRNPVIDVEIAYSGTGASDTTFWAVTSAGRGYRRLPNSSSWEQKLFAPGIPAKLQFFGTQNGWFGATGQPAFFHTTNGGNEWDQVATGLQIGDYSMSEVMPDVRVGRLPSKPGTGEAGSIIDKLMAYQTCPDAEMLSQVHFYVGGATDDHTIEPTDDRWNVIARHEALQSELWHQAALPPATELYTPQYYGASGLFDKANLIAALNSGPHLVGECWHAGVMEWVCPTNTRPEGWFRYTTADSLLNAGKEGMVFTHGCHGLYLLDDNSLGRHFLTCPLGGSVAYGGTSVQNYFVVAPLYLSLIGRVWRDGLSQIGAAYELATTDKRGESRDRITENLLGDPLMDIWTAVPGGLNVTWDPQSLSLEPTSLTVTATDASDIPVDGATVCLSLKDPASGIYNLYHVGVTTEAGTATFNLDPKQTGEMVVSVTKHNYLPYRGACHIGMYSDDAGAMANSQQRNIARVAGKNTLHIVYTSDDSVMHSVSYDAGQSWTRPQPIDKGENPAITLNYPPQGAVRSEPWIVYKQGSNLKVAILHGSAAPVIQTLFTGATNGDSLALPASVVSEPSMASCPSAWVTYEVSKAAGSLRRTSIRVKEFTDQGVIGSWMLDDQTQVECSQPSIAITPGTSVHVAWQRSTPTAASVWYGERTSQWSTPLLVSQTQPGAHCPFVEAWGDEVRVAWVAPTVSPDIYVRSRVRGSWLPRQTVCQTPGASENPVLALKTVESWQEEVCGQTDVYVRINGDESNLSATEGNSTFPSIDAMTDPATGRTTVFGVWTEEVEPGNLYEVRFATRNWLPQGPYGSAAVYYSVATGESLPSEYCESRDSAVACDGYALDFGADSLTYRLPYLDPQYDYEAQFVVYHDSGGTWRQSVSVEDTLEDRVSYRREEPETVLVSISPGAYEEDAEVRLQNEKLRGAGCVVAELNVIQLEPAPRDTGSGSGGGSQSRAAVPLRARLFEPRPSLFTDRVELSFSLTVPAKADLRAYDATGRVVRRLVSGECRAGTTNVTWDGCGVSGSPLPAGAYFVRLVTDAGSSVRKVVLSR